MSTRLATRLLAAACPLVLAAPPALAADDQVAVVEDASGQVLGVNLGCMMWSSGLCPPAASKAFYVQHPDAYDVLVFFTTAKLIGNTTAKAGLPVQADVKGIGLDSTAWPIGQTGSKGRLLQLVTVGSLSSLPDDPAGTFEGPPYVSGLEVVAHEIGHHWMAYASADLGYGPVPVLRGWQDGTEGQGSANLHWSCWFASDSVMYGGILTDHGDGTFTNVNGPRRFTPFDQYLMGLRPAAEVGPLWLVDTGVGLSHGCVDFPDRPGTPHVYEGERVDFSIDDVIAALGPRVPATSKCHLKVGFGLVHPKGQPPSAAEVAKVEAYRQALEAWWPGATDDRGSVDTRLDGCGTGTATCPGEPSPQCATPVEPDPEPVPEAGNEPAPEPVPDPVPEPVPDPVPEPVPESLPDRPADAAEASPEAATPCTPGALSCAGDTLLRCRVDGAGTVVVEACSDQGGRCLEGDGTAFCKLPSSGGAGGGCAAGPAGGLAGWLALGAALLGVRRRR